MSLREQLEAAKAEVLRRCDRFPRILIVLGSGLSGLVKQIEIETEIPYPSIPHFRQSTVSGHPGKLVIGTLGTTRVACMSGRLHGYEGYSLAEVVFPFRVFALAGADTFFLTNASGGLHAGFDAPELVIVKDHLNLMNSNPLVGPNEEFLGPRFPELSEVYDAGLRRKIHEAGKSLGVNLKEGVYVALQGPYYETPAEVKMYRAFGGDMVGMSTVPEAIALRHMGRKVAALSCVTNLTAGVAPEVPNHEEVLKNAEKIQSLFVALVTKVVGTL